MNINKIILNSLTLFIYLEMEMMKTGAINNELMMTYNILAEKPALRRIIDTRNNEGMKLIIKYNLFEVLPALKLIDSSEDSSNKKRRS